MFYGLLLAFLGNKKFLEALTAENCEVKAKLRDLGTPPRSLKKKKKKIFLEDLIADAHHV